MADGLIQISRPEVKERTKLVPIPKTLIDDAPERFTPKSIQEIRDKAEGKGIFKFLKEHWTPGEMRPISINDHLTFGGDFVELFSSRVVEEIGREIALDGGREPLKAAVRKIVCEAENLSDFGVKLQGELKALGIRYDANSIVDKINSIDTSVELCGRKFDMPIRIGDMSFGSLHKYIKIILANTAKICNVRCGDGEGGLLSELFGHALIEVQFASARFGRNMLKALEMAWAVVIKDGQGAKGGLPGQLPGNKVHGEVAEMRGYPVGTDAVSTSVHEDTYSIEDKGAQGRALDEASDGKPVFDKIAAVNYAPFVAAGIARMGMKEVILDGWGAGTGSTPVIAADKICLPVEIVVPACSKILRQERNLETGKTLREECGLSGGGGIKSGLDVLKLITLGADNATIGTAILEAMGCIGARDCENKKGACPAAIAHQRPISIQIETGTKLASQFLKSMQQEMRIALFVLGKDSINDVKGKASGLMYAVGLQEDTIDVMGVRPHPQNDVMIDWERFWNADERNDSVFVGRTIRHIKHLAETGLPETMSMGSIAPPIIERPKTITDHLKLNAAQITNPSIDPYREPIEISVRLGRNGERRNTTPVMIAALPEQDDDTREAVVRAARMASTVVLVKKEDAARLKDYRKNMLVEIGLKEGKPEIKIDLQGVCGVVIRDIIGQDMYEEELPEMIYHMKNANNAQVYVKLNAGDIAIKEKAEIYAIAGVDGIIIEGEQSKRTNDLFTKIRELDVALNAVKMKAIEESKEDEGDPIRKHVSLIAYGHNIRDAGDIMCLGAAGADSVIISKAAELAVATAEEKVDKKGARERLVKFMRGTNFEIKLLLGAGGKSNWQNAHVGDIGHLRSVELERELREAIPGLLPAGR